VVAVDKAGTEGGDGAYTAIVTMHKTKDGRFVIERVVRGHWGALERERMIKQVADDVREGAGAVVGNASSFTAQSVRDVVVVSNHGRRSRARIMSVLGGWSRRTMAIIFPHSFFSDGARTASPNLLSTSGLRFCCSTSR
jgi:hypothetical protein